MKNPTQLELFERPRGDVRLLEPGWAGELAVDELEFVHVEVHQDKKLSYIWGFRSGEKRRLESAIRQVSMWGDPNSRSVNLDLARRKIQML